MDLPIRFRDFSTGNSISINMVHHYAYLCHQEIKKRYLKQKLNKAISNNGWLSIVNETVNKNKMSLCLKTNNLDSNLARHKTACTITEA